jgi:hypothetical protein
MSCQILSLSDKNIENTENIAYIAQVNSQLLKWHYVKIFYTKFYPNNSSNMRTVEIHLHS